MARTLGYHIVKSGYGLWLPGDERGSWSDAWDKELGFIEPHALHHGDATRRRMAQERMKHAALRFTADMMDAIADATGECVARSCGGLSVSAASIESTHMHLLIPYSGRDIEQTCRWLADQTTKAVHRRTVYQGPVWCKGRWRGFIYTDAQWRATASYIRRHNVRRGVPERPYDWVATM